MINVDFIDSSEVTTERIYQWDIGRKLKISNVGSAVAPVVHFCNKKSENALAVESITSGDFYIASIPNSLLQEEYDIIAYIYVGSEEEAKTIKVVHIPVSKRLKPETYVTTEDENVIDFLTISTEMKSLLNGLVITEYDSTKSYIKPNIVYYKGSSYICISETSITNILPTDTTKWGLMCKNGANISEITFSNDVLYFKLENGDTIDVPLGTVEVSVVESVITPDEDGILKIGDAVIPQIRYLSKWITNVINRMEITETLNPGDILEIQGYFADADTANINSFIFTSKLPAIFLNGADGTTNLQIWCSDIDINNTHYIFEMSYKSLSDDKAISFKVLELDDSSTRFETDKIVFISSIAKVIK